MNIMVGMLICQAISAHIILKFDYDKPVIISEFGGGALGGFHADAETRFSEEFQEAIYQNQFKLLTLLMV